MKSEVYRRLNWRLILTASLFLGMAMVWSSCTEGSATSELNINTNQEYSIIPETISFNYHVRPILSDRCFKCHGPDKSKIEAGLSFHNKESALSAIGEEKDHFAIYPGNIEKSELIRRIFSEDPNQRMPPPTSNLSLESWEKEILKKWIEQGAKWEDHWAFEPIINPKVPESLSPDLVNNEIDNFIQDRLNQSILKPSEKASAERLVRRLAFDLTGLPPSFQEIDKLKAENNNLVYEQIVDDYLSSSAYAEHMTSIWLDLSRYADTHGYQDDLERTMWPWRDWVIHAFSQNMPYDEFVTWQLAGDLFPNASKEQILATGFNRNHKITQEGGVIPEEYRVEYVSDRTMTFGKAFLALTVECAKCHDHKYDPISQKDYYSLFAFFNNVPEKGLIESYGITPEPYMTLTADEIKDQLKFINNLEQKDSLKLMVMKAQPKKRKTYILGRGVYDNPQEQVFASMPASILAFEGYENDRLGLSKWLFNKNNPLTARAFVNRLWQMCFGKGLVATIDDFGSQGALPSHPELLDHLAYKFMNEGWDIQAMLKYIVSSYTYQQSSIITEEDLLVDPKNKLYSRAPRLRLSAEKIRDHGLFTSELLSNVLGGPSVKPYQPEGLWEEVIGGGGGSTAKYVKDTTENQYRRSLYTFWKRTVPPPAMMTFDAVTRDFCMVNRESTSTPLQALVMMNNPEILEATRNLAYLAIANEDNIDTRIEFIFRKATSRNPTTKELKTLKSYWNQEFERFQKHPKDAEAMLTIGDSPNTSTLPTTETAAYAIVANAIFNLDESITRS